MIKAIVFDVDDTLYDQQQTFQQAVLQHFPVRQADTSELYLRFRHHSDDKFAETESGAWSLEQMRLHRIQAALKDLGYSASDLQAQNFQQDYEQALDKISSPYEIKAVLTYLSEQNYPLAVITNGPKEHQEKKIQQLELTQWIDQTAFFISGAVGFAKPRIEIFTKAQTYLGFNKEELLYIGDSFENDVLGAKNAGWKAWWFNHRNRKIPESTAVLPDKTITSFEELLLTTKEIL